MRSRFLSMMLTVSLLVACRPVTTSTPPLQPATAAATPLPSATPVSPTATMTAAPTRTPTATATPTATPVPCETLCPASPGAARFDPLPSTAGAIAYSDRDGGLSLAFADGGDTVRVYPRELPENVRSFTTYLTWSPDGQRLAFVCGFFEKTTPCGSASLLLADFPKGEVRVLLESSACGQASWSPDGQWLAFAEYSHKGNVGQLRLLHVATGRLSNVGERATGDGWQAPAWIDDEHVAYLR